MWRSGVQLTLVAFEITLQITFVALDVVQFYFLAKTMKVHLNYYYKHNITNWAVLATSDALFFICNLLNIYGFDFFGDTLFVDFFVTG